MSKHKAGRPLRNTLYLQEPGDAGSVEVSDIHQGQIADCYFLAALGEIAIRDPDFITGNIIAGASEDGEVVRLYNDGSGGAARYNSPTLVEHDVSVTNDFSSDGVNGLKRQASAKGQKEIWPQVIEKAYSDDIGGFTGLDGNAGDALASLTGKQATYEPIANATLNEISQLITGGSLMVFGSHGHPGTQDAPGPYNLIGDHDYAFSGLSQDASGQVCLNLVNPWGKTQPDPIPISQIPNVLSVFVHGSI